MTDIKEPNYYAVIPSTVRYDANLKFAERLLYGEITALIGKEGYCFASNQYFAKLYNVIPGTISNWISHLKNLGYIKVDIIRNDKKQIIERRIYITDNSYRVNVLNTYTSNKTYPYTLNKRYPMLQKAKDNNIDNIKIDRLFNYIIYSKGEFPEEFLDEKDFSKFYEVIVRLELNYTKESIKVIKDNNREKLKIIIFAIKEIYKSKKKNLLAKAKRNDLTDIYDNCKKFELLYKNTNKEINNFFEYYYISLIKKLES